MNKQRSTPTMSDRFRRFFKQLAGPQQPWLSPRGLLLFILPLPIIPALVISLAKGDFSGAFVHISVGTLFLFGAILARRGLQQAAMPMGSSISRRILPLRTFAAVMVALATGLSSWLSVGQTPLFAMMVFALTLLAFYLSYGLDPVDVSHHEGEGKVDHDFVMNMLIEAEEKILRIENIAQHVGQLELKNRLLRISDLARDIVQRVELQPVELPRARQFLYVYLDGALRVTEAYGKTHSQLAGNELESKFRNVLDTIEDVFTHQKSRLAQNDLLDLDVQIDVLNKQLSQEGFR